MARNPQDATRRNVKAANERHKKLAARVKKLESEVKRLAKVLAKALR